MASSLHPRVVPSPGLGRATLGPRRTSLNPTGLRPGPVHRRLLVALLLAGVLAVSCGRNAGPDTRSAADPHLRTNGTIEVTARLPQGAIFKRDLYDYATILKYQVLKVHRGQVRAETIYVGHYNPWKPRSEAADARVKNIGGTLRKFAAGQVHHLALDAPIEDCFMGGIVNKYFGQTTGPLYWAVWTDAQDE